MSFSVTEITGQLEVPLKIKNSVHCFKKQTNTQSTDNSGAGKQSVDPREEKKNIIMPINTISKK